MGCTLVIPSLSPSTIHHSKYTICHIIPKYMLIRLIRPLSTTNWYNPYPQFPPIHYHSSSLPETTMEMDAYINLEISIPGLRNNRPIQWYFPVNMFPCFYYPQLFPSELHHGWFQGSFLPITHPFYARRTRLFRQLLPLLHQTMAPVAPSGRAKNLGPWASRPQSPRTSCSSKSWPGTTWVDQAIIDDLVVWRVVTRVTRPHLSGVAKFGEDVGKTWTNLSGKKTAYNTMCIYN